MWVCGGGSMSVEVLHVCVVRSFGPVVLMLVWVVARTGGSIVVVVVFFFFFKSKLWWWIFGFSVILGVYFRIFGFALICDGCGL